MDTLQAYNKCQLAKARGCKIKDLDWKKLEKNIRGYLNDCNN